MFDLCHERSSPVSVEIIWMAAGVESSAFKRLDVQAPDDCLPDNSRRFAAAR
jgi:hypothetical protein